MSDTEPAESFAVRLRALAGESTLGEPLQQLGRRLLIARPLVPDAAPGGEDDPTTEGRSEWIDDQLYDCLPWQTELNGLDDARHSALEEAWPDGFDEVVFSGGEQDDDFARSLVESYLWWAERFGLPLMTDFEVTQEDMEEELASEFRQVIAQWRENVLKKMGKQHVSKP